MIGLYQNNFLFFRRSIRSYSQQAEQPETLVESPLPSASDLQLPKENAFPTFYKPRASGTVYKLKEGPKGELLADYVLFKYSIQKSEVRWLKYNDLTSAEKTIQMAHLAAVERRKLEYKDPFDKKMHPTISTLLYQQKCCGKACRHCPYELEGCSEEVRKSVVFNGAYYL